MNVDAVVQDLVDYLVKEGYSEEIPQFSKELSRLAATMALEKRILVTTALPLSEKEKDELKDNLEKIFGMKFTSLENEVDKKIIGGMKVQIGDIVVDASIKGQIERMKEALLS